jgi:hypothetical protein
MRFKNYINEITATNYKVDKRESSNNIELWIHIGDNPKDIFIVRIGYESYSKSMIEMRFRINLKNMEDSGKRYSSIESVPFWDINFTDYMGNDNLAKKGKGVAIRLFAALEKEIGTLINKRKPEVMRFRVSDHEESRFKLYKKIASKIVKNGKYNLYTSGKQFWFIRKEFVK